MKYSVIYADPPWRYDDATPPSGGCPYPTMSIAELKALPVRSLAAPDCVLFMWATMPLLTEALELISAWGFSYRTCAFVWIKQNRRAGEKQPMLFYPGDKQAFNIFAGMGRWTQGNAELCLLAKRGTPKRMKKDIKQVILAPLSRHSAKPAETRDRIVRLMGDVPRVELFARERADGWDVWGNEVESDITLPMVAGVEGLTDAAS
jgi:N6-adenosine-specific RNA methylase IME4